LVQGQSNILFFSFGIGNSLTGILINSLYHSLFSSSSSIGKLGFSPAYGSTSTISPIKSRPDFVGFTNSLLAQISLDSFPMAEIPDSPNVFQAFTIPTFLI